MGQYPEVSGDVSGGLKGDRDISQSDLGMGTPQGELRRTGESPKRTWGGQGRLSEGPGGLGTCGGGEGQHLRGTWGTREPPWGTAGDQDSS